MSESSSAAIQPARADRNPITRAVLLGLNRWLLAGIIFGIGFFCLVVGSQVGLTPIQEIAALRDGLVFLFSVFIGAIITGTSIVVTIAQLVLAQELGAVGDQQQRMTESVAFRRDVESLLETDVSSPTPAGFLTEILSALDRQATVFSTAATAAGDPSLSAAAETYAADLSQRSEAVVEKLDGANFGDFSVISAALLFNYSRHIYEAKQLRSQHADALSSEADDALSSILELLSLFAPAREHFKTLYFQWELLTVSRALLYTSVPALLVMGLMSMYLDAMTLSGTVAGVEMVVWVTSAAFMIGLSPFIIFTVFILRIATVAQDTLAMGPFVLQ